MHSKRSRSNPAMTVALTGPSLALIVAGGALAQEAAMQTAAPSSAATRTVETRQSDVRVVVAGGYLHQFDTEFDGDPGEVSIDRGYGAVGLGFALDPAIDLGLRLSWEGGWYHFDGASPLSLGTGGRPWHAVQSVQLGGRLGWKVDDQWSLTFGLFGGASGENDADVGDALSIGGSVGASWRASDTFSIGGGVLVSSQIEDDALVIPLLLIDWRITDTLRLTNVAGPEAYPTGAGLELVWSVTEEIDFGFGGKYESRRFRLDDDAPAPEGIGEDRSFGLWLRVGIEPLPRLRFDVLGGAMVYEELELSNSGGSELASVDLDPSPFVAAFLSYRF